METTASSLLPLEQFNAILNRELVVRGQQPLNLMRTNASPFLDFGQMDEMLNRKLELRGQPPLISYDEFRQSLNNELHARGLAGLGEPEPPPQRGVVGQIIAGAERGPFIGAAQIPRTLSAIPGLRSTFEPVAKAIENIPPASSGGAIEQGVESATAFLTNLLLFRGGASIISRVAPTIGAALGSETGLSTQIIASFGGSEFAQTRQELEDINKTLPADQKIPTDDITRAALISGVAESGFEVLSTPFIVGRLLRLTPGTSRQAIEALASAFRDPTSLLGRAARRVAETAITEIPTEAATAAVQAQARREVLEPRGIPGVSPGQAARGAIAPTAISSALLAGVTGAVSRRQIQPMEPAAIEVQERAKESRAQLPGLPAVRTGTEAGFRPQPQEPSATAIAQQAIDAIVETHEGRRGVVFTNPYGILEFMPSSTDLPVSAPRVQAEAGEFQALFGTPEQGIAPEAITAARRAFVSRQGLDLGRLANVEPSVAAPGAAATPQAETAPPLENRLRGAEETALNFVIARQDRGFQGFDFSAAAEQLSIVHDIPRQDAQRILQSALGVAGQRFEGTPLIQVQPQRQRPGRPTGATPLSPAPPVTTTTQVTTAATSRAPETEGIVATVRTDRGREVDTRYVVVNANDLITSNDLAGNVNPAFPQELQPRDRTRVTSQEQVARIASRLDPELLAESRLASIGAPIVGSDLVVESGNARTLGVRLAYQSGQPDAQQYRQFLLENAERFGISRAQVEQITNPILVRVRRTDMDLNDRIAFTREANEQTQQAFSAVERARTDANRLTPGMLAVFNPDQSGNVAAASNREFVRQFLQQLPAAERGALVTPDGQLSQEGVQRIRNAIFTRAYGNTPTLERLAEDPDSNIRNITTAMLLASPQLVRVKEGIQQGTLFDLDLTPDIAAAASKLSSLRDQNTSVDAYLRQGGLFGEELSPLSTDIIRILDANKRSAQRLAAIFRAIGERVRQIGDPRQSAMFAVAVPTKAEILQSAINQVEATHGQIQIDLTGEARSGQASRFALARPGASAQAPTRTGAPQGTTLFPEAAQQFQLTRSSLTRAFPRQRVTRNGDGTFTVHTPRGQVLVKSVATIEPDHAAIELSYGRKLEAGERPVGQFQQLKDGTFEIRVTPDATEETLFHEAGHFFEDAGILSNQDITTLNAALRRQNLTPTVETRADFIAQQLNRVTNRNRPLDRIIYRIQRFMDRFARAIGIRTAGQVIRRIQSGDITTPGARLPITPRFAVRQTEGQQRRFQAITPEVEGKLYRDYVSFSNMFPDNVARQFGQQFPKERVSLPAMRDEVSAILDQWSNNPQELKRVLDMVRFGRGLPTEFQTEGLRALADGMWQQQYDALQAGQITQEAFTEFENAWFGMGSILNVAQIARSAAARSLRFGQEGPQVEAFQAFMQRLRAKEAALTPEELAQLRQQARDAYVRGDRNALRNMGQQLESPRLRDYFFEFYYGSILSSPATFNVNLFSTYGFIQLHNALVRGVTGALDPIVARLQGRSRQFYTNEALPAFGSGFKGLPQAFRRFWWLWTGRGKERVDLPGLSKFQRERGRAAGAWHRATWSRDIPELGIKAGEPIQWMRRAAPVVTVATRALEAADVGLRGLAFESGLAARARRAAMQQLGRPDVAFETEYINTIDQRPAERKALLDEAARLTFTDAPGALARLLMRTREVPGLGPFLQLLVPFASTPDRLLARGFEFVPGATIIPEIWHRTEWNGWMPRVDFKMNPDPRLAEIAAKQLIGTVLSMMMYALWKSGSLTGDVPDDPTERDAFFRAGKLPFSFISANGTVVQWRRFEPISLPLGIAVSAFEAIERIQRRRAEQGQPLFGDPAQGVDDTLAIAAVASRSMAHYIIDGSYFRGLAEFFASTSRTGGTVPRGLFRQLATIVTPFSSLNRSLIRFMDASGVGPQTEPGTMIIREGKTFSQILAGGIPGLAQRVPVRLDALGRPIRQRPAQGALEALGLPTPLRTSTITDDPVELALAQAGYTPGHVNQKSLEHSLRRRVSREEFQQFQIRRGEIARQDLLRIIDAPFFRNLSPDRQAERMRAIFRRASRRARKELQRGRRSAGFGF